MFRSFSEIEQWILEENEDVKIALACCHDKDTLESISYARRKGVISGAILVGKTDIAKTVLESIGESFEHYTFIDEDNELNKNKTCKSSNERTYAYCCFFASSIGQGKWLD